MMFFGDYALSDWQVVLVGRGSEGLWARPWFLPMWVNCTCSQCRSSGPKPTFKPQWVEIISRLRTIPKSFSVKITETIGTSEKRGYQGICGRPSPTRHRIWSSLSIFCMCTLVGKVFWVSPKPFLPLPFLFIIRYPVWYNPSTLDTTFPLHPSPPTQSYLSGNRRTSPWVTGTLSVCVLVNHISSLSQWGCVRYLQSSFQSSLHMSEERHFL